MPLLGNAYDIWWLGVNDRPSSKVRCFFFSLSLSHWFSSSLFDFIFILFYFFGVFFISFKFSLVGWFEFLRKGEKSRRRFPFLFGMIFVSSSSFSSFGFFFFYLFFFFFFLFFFSSLCPTGNRFGDLRPHVTRSPLTLTEMSFVFQPEFQLGC